MFRFNKKKLSPPRGGYDYVKIQIACFVLKKEEKEIKLIILDFNTIN